MLESKIQASIIKKLSNNGWLCIKLIQTNWNGIPDLLCLKYGSTVFIEVKQVGKNPTHLQEVRHDQLRRQAFKVLVARSTDDIEELLV